MIKISDFTPSVSRHHSQCNSANCKVVINNSGQSALAPRSTPTRPLSCSIYPDMKTRTVVINSGDEEHQTTQQATQQATTQETTEMSPEQNPQTISQVNYPLQQEQVYEEVPSNYIQLYKHLAKTFSSILKTINAKLLANIIDPSGKVILDGQNLAVAIALLLNTDESNVKISYEDPDVACIGKVNPIKKISTIKVNGYDFNLMYNKEYNVLGEEFDVSLSSVLIFKIEAIKYGH